MNKKRKTLNVVDPTPFIKDLESDQLLAFTEMVHFIDTADDSMLLLKGFAGTGKTFTITRFVQYCMELSTQQVMTNNPKAAHKNGPPSIAITAPTNKAVQVLREASDRSLFEMVKFSTIHQLLGLKEVINDSGIVEFRNDFDNNPEISTKDILILDEVSMLNDDLFYQIKNYAPTIKIIFLGDPCQIPPVGQEDCEPFLNPELHNIKIIELTKIMRQKEGSKIIGASLFVRNNIENAYTKFSGNFTLDGSELSLYDSDAQRTDLTAVMKEKMASDEFIENYNSLKVIAWRNAKVAEYNKFIRKHYGMKVWDSSKGPTLKIMVLDRMITNEPVIQEKNGSQVIIMHTNQEFIVKASEIQTNTFENPHQEVELKYYYITAEFYNVEEDRIVTRDFRILHEDSQSVFDRTLLAIKNSALYAPANKKGWFWREYYQFMRRFANVSYGYAITAHKSQGSTYHNVIVDVNDLMLNRNVKERNRILYTAMTRAKNSLILIN